MNEAFLYSQTPKDLEKLPWVLILFDQYAILPNYNIYIYMNNNVVSPFHSNNTSFCALKITTLEKYSEYHS